MTRASYKYTTHLWLGLSSHLIIKQWIEKDLQMTKQLNVKQIRITKCENEMKMKMK